ncbi:ribonuclease P protein component 1 [Halobellus ruber]|uniref:Ribonuclease P protein component 1 n=1 Tax=Halobellus ruber TaxID=2761102 RepID=A0A7J9SD33_9EURY|nr:ribonuclease P protein component 1 [Halobellus ruber]MBB6644825.1 ribonuclease P protein component 1 [Halobellus ruber]
MALTPETLTRHELNGLRVAVVDAPNPDLVGTAGRVVGETMRTLRVAVEPSAPGDGASDASVAASRVKQVPKRGSTFEFELPPGDDPECTDEAADVAKASGTASELRSETASGLDAGQSGRCQGAAYVTVDGTRLLSRPALRTEKRGDSLWR